MIKNILITIFVSLFSVSCSYFSGSREIASKKLISQEQPPVEQGEVWGDQEMQEANLVRDNFRDMLLESTGESNHMKRDAHPKSHGCVRAELKLDNSLLKNRYRVGMFEYNNSYKAWIRFSNGDPNVMKSDAEDDVRGMAVKLLDVPYETYTEKVGIENGNNIHDFVFMNSSEFFIKNPKDYGKFMKALKKGGMAMALYGIRAFLNPTNHFVGILKKAFSMEVGNPLDIDYHSATPYKLGKTSMKMKFSSCKKNKEGLPKKAAHNFLATRLENFLDSNSSCFDFYIQPNNNPQENNIENSQKKWSTSRSPFIKVGRLTISKQSKDSISSRKKFCENMTFNPWRAHEENRPMGGVNRIRLEVYVNQAKMRLKYNNIQFPGPTKE